MMFLLLFFLLLLRKVVLSLPLCFFMHLYGNTSYFKFIYLVYIFLVNQEYLTLKHHLRMTPGLFKCGVNNNSVSPFVHALPVCISPFLHLQWWIFSFHIFLHLTCQGYNSLSSLLPWFVHLEGGHHSFSFKWSVLSL